MNDPATTLLQRRGSFLKKEEGQAAEAGLPLMGEAL
jgi:hypothetical protein